MSRNIIPAKTQITAQITDADQPDSYSSKLLKLIPADIISIYLGLINLIKTRHGDTKGLQWIVLVIVLFLTPLYLKKGAKVKTNAQIVICTVSFLLWSLSLGGDLLSGIYILGNPDITLLFIISLLVPIYTFIVPTLYPTDEPAQ